MARKANPKESWFRSEVRHVGRLVLVGVLAVAGTSCNALDGIIKPKTLASYISGATWTHPPEGYRIVVDPSLFGRNHALDNPPRALAEALKAASPTPFTMTRKIRDSLTKQLRCHAEFAATKPRWDLEQWRPDVSYDDFVFALCNPGRP